MEVTLLKVRGLVLAIDPRAIFIEEMGGGYATICSDYAQQIAGDLTKQYDNVVGFSATRVVTRIKTKKVQE